MTLIYTVCSLFWVFLIEIICLEEGIHFKGHGFGRSSIYIIDIGDISNVFADTRL